MATNAAADALAVGPVPFKDLEPDVDMVSAITESPPEDHTDLVSALPRKTIAVMKMELRCYDGFWLTENWVSTAIALQRRFKPLPTDVIVASLFKSGTTWLIALTFATVARRAYPPGADDHPLRRLNPHQCLPFLEGLFSSGREGKLEGLPSPRLINTHMPLAMIPGAVPAHGGGGGCKVVYICREPKAMVVSKWHYLRLAFPELGLSELFDLICDGTMLCMPFWDHILGYWRASVAWPENVLFLRYEELLLDPAENVRRLAQFLGVPFSAEEEEAGVVGGIVELCSLDSLRSLELMNKTGYMDLHFKIPREALYRKGVADDWKNHMTPEMARRMDDVVADKFRGTGLTFP